MKVSRILGLLGLLLLCLPTVAAITDFNQDLSFAILMINKTNITAATTDQTGNAQNPSTATGANLWAMGISYDGVKANTTYTPLSSNLTTISSTTGVTVNSVLYLNDTTDHQFIMSMYNVGAFTGFGLQWLIGGTFKIFFGNGAGWVTTCAASGTYNAVGWYDVSLSYNGTNCTAVVNQTANNVNLVNTLAANAATPLYLADNSGSLGTNNFKGTIARVCIWKRYMTSDQLKELDSYGENYNCYTPPPPPPPANFSVATRNRFDNSTIHNASILMNSSGTVYDFNATDGIIETNISINDSRRWNITVISNQSGGYFNVTYFDVNISSSPYNATLFQAEVRFNASEIITFNALYGGNVTISSTTRGQNDTWYLNATSFTVRYNRSAYYNYSLSFTYSAMSNATYNITGIYNHILRIYLNDSVYNTTISPVYATITNNSYTVTATGSNFAQFNTLATNFSVNASGINYNQSTANVLLTGGLNTTNLTLYSQVVQTVYLEIYDETTRTLLNNTNVTVAVFSDTYSKNFSTANGTLFIPDLGAGNFTLKFQALNYSDLRNYYFEIPASSAANIKLYALDDDISQLTTVTVLDLEFQPVENAIVRLLRAYPSDGNPTVYLVVDMARTSYAGEGFVYTVPYDVDYKMMVLTDNVVRFTSNTFSVTDSNIEMNIPLTSQILFPISKTSQIAATAILNKTSNVVTYTFADTQGYTHEFCLDIDRVSGQSSTNVHNQCTNTSSGQLTFNFSTINYNNSNFVIEGNVKLENYTVPVAVKEHSFKNSYDLFGVGGAFFSLLIFLTLILWKVDSPTTQNLIGGFGLAICVFIGLLNISYGFLAFIIIGSIYLAARYKASA